MTTVVLILLCLAIAGRELYLAFDRRLPQAQAEIRELRGRVEELTRLLEQAPPETAQEDEPAESAEPAAPADEAEQAPEPGPLTRQAPPAPAAASAAAAVSTALIRRLERELGEVTARLAALEQQVAAARSAEAARADALDELEQAVATLYREMIERLEREGGLVRGRLSAAEEALEPVLTTAYERCVREIGLRVRAKESTGTSPWRTGYLLTGREPAGEVAARLAAQARALPGDETSAPLHALLTELSRLQGTGAAQIGAFTAVRVHDALICGLLEEEPDRADPAELAARLEGSATTVRWEPELFPALD